MKKHIKTWILGLITGLIMMGTISLSSTLIVGDVYINPFKILLNGFIYETEMPILNYEGRTYVPLRELATLTGSEVDFEDNNIIINCTEKDVPVIITDLIFEYGSYHLEFQELEPVTFTNEEFEEIKNGKEILLPDLNKVISGNKNEETMTYLNYKFKYIDDSLYSVNNDEEEGYIITKNNNMNVLFLLNHDLSDITMCYKKKGDIQNFSINSFANIQNYYDFSSKNIEEVCTIRTANEIYPTISTTIDINRTSKDCIGITKLFLDHN